MLSESFFLSKTHTHTQTCLGTTRMQKEEKGKGKKGFLSCLKVDCYYHIIKSNNHVQTVQNEALNVFELCELCVCVCVCVCV